MRRSCLLVVLAWLFQSAAAAQPAALPLELTWRAPSECPSASEVHAELARIASAAPGEDLRPLVADIAVSRTGSRYAAALRTEHEGLVGERTLQADDCATLTRSVMLVLALAFGRGVQLRGEPAADGESAAPEQTPAPAATSGAAQAEQSDEHARAQHDEDVVEVEEPGDTEPSSIRLGALIGGGAQLTLMPRVAPVFTLGAALDLELLSIELRASALTGTSEPLDTGTGARAVLDGAVATALACARVSLADLCAGGRGGAIRARSRGLFEVGKEIAPWYALAVTAGAHWPEEGPVQLGLEALLAISVTRPRYAIIGYGDAYRIPLLAPELSAFLRVWP